MARLAAVFLALLAFPAARAAETPPPVRPLETHPWAALTNRDVSPLGQGALAFRPERWLHGETEHFILHFRRVTEANRVALEIEYHLWFVARRLLAGPERYARKSHVFIFEDEKDWGDFKTRSAGALPPWAGSLAVGDELFLSVREGRTGLFDSRTLAHETTHAVVARLYPGRRWPRWLGEGFAEVMSGVSVSARMGQYSRQFQRRLPGGDLSLDELLSAEGYPPTPQGVLRFYQSAERVVRFLINDHPPERFPAFIDALLADPADFLGAVGRVYPERYADPNAFRVRFERYRLLNP